MPGVGRLSAPKPSEAKAISRAVNFSGADMVPLFLFLFSAVALRPNAASRNFVFNEVVEVIGLTRDFNLLGVSTAL